MSPGPGKAAGATILVVDDSPDALELMKRHLGPPWPGNARELENLVQRLMAMAEGSILDAPDLPAGTRSECIAEERGLNRTQVQVEAEYIRHVLEAVEGNKSRAAKILGIDRKTLRENSGAIRGATQSNLNFSAIVSPIEQCLPLLRPAAPIARFAMLPDLSNVPLHRLPSLDLTFIIRASSAHVVSAIPLKPTARVFRIDPPLFAPDRQGQRSVDSKVIHFGIMALGAQFGARKPAFRKLIAAIGHVSAAENTHFQHLRRC
jgi:Bacterial regulatory protein, Fis family